MIRISMSNSRSKFGKNKFVCIVYICSQDILGAGAQPKGDNSTKSQLFAYSTPHFLPQNWQKFWKKMTYEKDCLWKTIILSLGVKFEIFLKIFQWKMALLEFWRQIWPYFLYINQFDAILNSKKSHFCKPVKKSFTIFILEKLVSLSSIFRNFPKMY